MFRCLTGNDDIVQCSLWERRGHTKKVHDARYAVHFRRQSWVLVIQVDRRMLGEVAGGSAMSDLASIEGLASHPWPQARRAQRMLPESSHR